jgi:hypothetical protein
MRRRDFLTTAAATVGLSLLTRPSRAGADPAVVGAWSPRHRLPHIAIHSTLVPGTSQVFHLAIKSVPGNTAPGSLGWFLEPSTGQVDLVAIPFPYDAMCGGGVLDDEGHLRMYGGIIAAEKSAVLDLGTRRWTQGPFMSKHQGAYYPSAVRTGPVAGYPHGAVVVAFGRRSWMDVYDADEYQVAELHRMPDAVNRGELAGPSSVYPRLMPIPDGRLFLAGTQAAMWTLDVSKPVWTHVADMSWGRRYEGCATSIGPSGYEFFLTGGADPWQPNNEVVDARTGAKRTVHPPIVQRKQLNTVVLPDGTILVIGGYTNDLRPELYDPVADTMTALAPPLPQGPPPDQGPCLRGYHSTAELLNDGRVLWAGGTTGTRGFSYEVFSPPYLARGPRPSVTLTSGALVAPGGIVTLSGLSPGVSRVTLLRAEHSTHGYNAGQRCYDLVWRQAGGVVVATMPASRLDAPPGWYRIFVHAGGVPSIGQWVRLV